MNTQQAHKYWQRRCPINYDFLEHWSDNLAYFLGWLAGDGNITGQHIYIGTKDEEIGKKFQEWIAPRNKIVFRKKERDYLFQLNRKKVASILASYDVKNPTIWQRVPKIHMPSFVRGFFEADGCVRKKAGSIPLNRGGKAFLEATFVQKDRKFLEGLVRVLLRWTIKTSKFWQTHSGCWQFSVFGKEALKLASQMYAYYEDMFFLRRKYFIFKEFAPEMNPIYEFKCGDCGAVIEAVIPMNARNGTLVCHCGGSAERIFSGFNVSVDRGHHYDGKYRNKCESDLHKDTPYELAVKQWKHIKRMGGGDPQRFKKWEKTIKRQRKDRSVVRLLQETERRQRERRQSATQIAEQQI